MSKKLVFVLCVIYSLNSYAVNIHWGNITTTTCESGDDIIVPTDEPTPQLGYHFVGWQLGIHRIEYLESTGTQYIDTRIKQSDYLQNLIVKTTFQYTDNHTSNYILGAIDTRKWLFFIPFFIRDNVFMSNVGDGGTEITVGNADTNIHTFICDTSTGTITFDNNTFTYNSNIANIQYSIYLFGRSYNGTEQGFSKVKIYNISFSDGNNTLLRNMFPVIDANGVPGMYDQVEGKIYYNAGTGAFRTGPVLESSMKTNQIFNSGSTISNGCDTVLNDIYFYPVYEPNVIDLKWNDRETITNGQCTYGTNIELPNDPVRPGYIFSGWRVKKAE